MEAAPTCFGLQRNYHQGTTASAQLKLQDLFSVDTLAQCTTHTPQYAAIALTTSAQRLYQH